MSIQDLGSLGELIGGVAVIVTILYLVIQTRQNNHLLKVNGFAQSYEQTWYAWTQVALNPDLADIMAKGYADPEALSDQEFQRFSAIMGCVVYGMENALYFREQGLVPHAIWENILENSRAYGFYDSPGFRHYVANRPGPVSQRLRQVLTERYGIDFDVTPVTLREHLESDSPPAHDLESARG